MADRSADRLQQALRDLEQAEQSMESGRHEWACFAAHQAVEKALKGMNLALDQQAWGHLHTPLGRPAAIGLAPGSPRAHQGNISADCRANRPFFMPASSSPGSVMCWPSAAEVLRAATVWAERQRTSHDDLLAAGVFGSYGRGDAGVGSDLDLVLILRECADPLWERLRRWDTGSLPLACDLLVYSLAEWRGLPGWNPRLATALQNDTRWLAGQPPGWEEEPGLSTGA